MLGNGSLPREAAEGMQASRGSITAKLVNAGGSAGWAFDLLVSRQPMLRSHAGGLLNQPLLPVLLKELDQPVLQHEEEHKISSPASCPQRTLLPSQYEDILRTLKQSCLEEGTPQHKLRPPARSARRPVQGKLCGL